MTRRKLKVGDVVTSGKRGTADFDTGTIQDFKDGGLYAFVWWYTGVATWQPVRLLRLAK